MNRRCVVLCVKVYLHREIRERLQVFRSPTPQHKLTLSGLTLPTFHGSHVKQTIRHTRTSLPPCPGPPGPYPRPATLLLALAIQKRTREHSWCARRYTGWTKRVCIVRRWSRGVFCGTQQNPNGQKQPSLHSLRALCVSTASSALELLTGFQHEPSIDFVFQKTWGYPLSVFNKNSTLTPRGGFLFTMFPHQEPCVQGPPSKNMVQILRGGSSYTRFLIRE